MTAHSNRRLVAPWCRIVREPGAPVYPSAAGDVPDGIIHGPADVYRLLAERAHAEEVEVFWVLLLDSQSRVRAAQEVTGGILNSSLVHPREVFRLAIAYGAAGIIVAHNHPSGDPTPSADDRAITRQLVGAGRILDLPVYDHVIIGRPGSYVSFSEAGLL